ncbi:hypothetical protein G5B39_13770 (plasmid) [Rhodobacteraceae bacterium SC52]|nr:hypothetical protein G5B39_13770 [Rhodobacteraceae bacterium SC52]
MSFLWSILSGAATTVLSEGKNIAIQTMLSGSPETNLARFRMKASRRVRTLLSTNPPSPETNHDIQRALARSFVQVCETWIAEIHNSRKPAKDWQLEAFADMVRQDCNDIWARSFQHDELFDFFLSGSTGVFGDAAQGLFESDPVSDAEDAIAMQAIDTALTDAVLKHYAKMWTQQNQSTCPSQPGEIWRARPRQGADAAFSSYNARLFNQFNTMLKSGEFPEATRAFQNYSVGAVRSEIKALAEAQRDARSEQARALQQIAQQIDQFDRFVTLSLNMTIQKLDEVAETLDGIAADMRQRHVPFGLALTKSVIDQESFLRFSYQNIAIPFQSRSAELARISSFLQADDDFLWWIVTGEGGAGKSRLALQACIEASRDLGWDAGFTQYQTLSPELDRIANWQPTRPTLFVIDYALADAEGVRKTLARFSRVWQQSGRSAVRILLIERRIDQLFVEQITRSPGDDATIAASFHAPEAPRIRQTDYAGQALQLGSLDMDADRYALGDCGYRLGGHEGSLEDILPPLAFAERHRQIDADERALTALLLGAAAGTGGDLPNVLDEILRRDFERFWPPEICAPGGPGSPVERLQPWARRLTALAAMTGGLDLATLQALVEDHGDKIRPTCPEGEEDGLLKRLQSVLGGRGASTVPPMQPDLLAEYVVLEALKPVGVFAPQDECWLADLAWTLNGDDDDDDAMETFALRVNQNFARHDSCQPALDCINRRRQGVPGSWMHNLRLALMSPDKLQGFAAAVSETVEQARGDAAAAQALGAALIAATAEDDPLLPYDLVFGSLAILRTAADDHDSDAIREAWAKASFNYIFDRAAEEPTDCRAMVDALRTAAADHDSDAIREEWAKASTNYINRRAAEEPADCRAMVDALRTAAEDHDGDAIREEWAKASTNYINRRAAEEPADCRAMIDALRTAADDHDSDAIRELWAKASTNYIADRAADEPADCRAMIDALRTAAEDHDSDAIREQWAKASTNYINRRAAEEPADCRAMIDALRTAADDHDSDAIRDEWAKASTNYIADRAAEEPADCRAMIDALRTAADDHDSDAIRDEWAKASFNYIARRAAEEPADCRAMIDALRTAADDHDSDAIRELWAKASTNYINRRAAEEPADCRAMIDALRTAADDHDSDAIREQWAKAVGALLHFAGAAQEAWVLQHLERTLTEIAPSESLVTVWGQAVGYVFGSISQDEDARRRLAEMVRRCAQAVESSKLAEGLREIAAQIERGGA